MWMFLVAQLASSALSPAEAVRILRASHSPADMTDYRAAPTSELLTLVVVERRTPPSERRPSQQPAPATPLPFNYGDPLGRFPALVQIVGDVRKAGR